MSLQSESPSQSDSTSSEPIRSTSESGSNSGGLRVVHVHHSNGRPRLPADRARIESKTGGWDSQCLSSAVTDPTLCAALSQRIVWNEWPDGSNKARSPAAGGNGYELSPVGHKYEYTLEVPLNDGAEVKQDGGGNKTTDAAPNMPPLSENASKQVVDPDTPDQIVCESPSIQ